MGIVHRAVRLLQVSKCHNIQLVAGLRDLPDPVSYRNVQFPPGPNEIPPVPKEPIFNAELGEYPAATTKSLVLIRGPELIHTDFIHKQFGVVALKGAMVHWEHFDVLRKTINRHLTKKMFAVLRLDAPWLPRTKLHQGSRMSDKKGSIHHYVTPVREGRVIVELGGQVTYDKARKILGEVAHKLPMEAQMFSWEEIVEKRAAERRVEQLNVNRFSWPFMMRWNMQNCSRFLSPYDYEWGGKYR